MLFIYARQRGRHVADEQQNRLAEPQRGASIMKKAKGQQQVRWVILRRMAFL